jgi:serine/threonine protein kinase
MVRHPFIVGLHYAFQTHDKLILIMTYCPGGDLLQLTKKLKNLDEDLIKKYAAEIILGI